MIQGTIETRVSPGKDLLLVEEGPMTRSRAKQVKEAMTLVVQATVDDMAILTKIGVSSMLGSRAESGLMSLIQATEPGK